MPHSQIIKLCRIEFKDDGSQLDVNIAIPLDVLDNDDDIFYYCNSLEELESLKNDEGGINDFIIKEILN